MADEEKELFAARGEYETLKEEVELIMKPSNYARVWIFNHLASSKIVDVQAVGDRLNIIDTHQNQAAALHPRIDELKSKWNFK